MARQRWTQFLKLGAMLLVGLGLLLTQMFAAPAGAISGVVVDDAGAISGAIVRLRATRNFTTTTADGSFMLTGLTEGITVPVTAWYPGYYIGQVEAAAPVSGIRLRLTPHPATDNPDYAWIYPHRVDSPPQVDYGCDTCHASIIVAQWESNAHAQAATSPRFLSMYNGTDAAGTPNVGPGYKLDFPGTAGNCATCHAPGAAANAPFTTDMNDLSPPASNGVFCDFCHKTAGIYLNPAGGRPYPNSPGVLSHDLRRPPEGQQMFFGPFDDVPNPDTYLPLMTQSQFCAACHSFSFWRTPIYQSFDEWLDSPYASQGVNCQDCHMAPDGVTTNFAPGEGGFERDPMTIPSHLQPGAAAVELLQNTVAMGVTLQPVSDKIEATVIITNTGAGHHVPTGHPGRHMILTVTATDPLGQTLPLLGGSTVPEWGGAQAGLPGKAFAKVLKDVQSGQWPVVSYWKQALIVSDNRIPALASDISRYAFAQPGGGGPVRITARLIFRRLFQPLAEAKGWDMPDIIMAETSTSLEISKEAE